MSERRFIVFASVAGIAFFGVVGAFQAYDERIETLEEKVSELRAEVRTLKEKEGVRERSEMVERFTDGR